MILDQLAPSDLRRLRAFRRVARKYCRAIEHAADHTEVEFLRTLNDLIAELWWRGQQLPDLDPWEDEPDDDEEEPPDGDEPNQVLSKHCRNQTLTFQHTWPTTGRHTLSSNRYWRHMTTIDWSSTPTHPMTVSVNRSRRVCRTTSRTFTLGSRRICVTTMSLLAMTRSSPLTCARGSGGSPFTHTGVCTISFLQ